MLRTVKGLIQKATNKMSKHVLIGFDFDHTIIDDNSDTYVLRLAPENGKLPDEITKLYSDKGWTMYMAEIFKYLHANGTTRSKLLDCLGEIPLVGGMSELLNFLKNGHRFEGSEVDFIFDVIIISDSNSVFIEHILGLADIKTNAVYTNPAAFDGDSCLTLKPYHHQDWCTLSSINLCKGHIFDEHRSSHELQRQQAYELAAFIGDGSNDLCPSLRLKASDLVFARKGFSLARRLAAVDGQKPAAKVVHWETGFDVLEELKSELKKLLLS